MIKISFLLGSFQGNGGIGRVVSLLANEFCKDEKLEISTIAYSNTNEPLMYKIEDEIHQYVLLDRTVSMKKAIVSHQIIEKLSNVIRHEGIDIIIACGALYFPIAVVAAKRTKIKCICWEHSNANNGLDHKFQNLCRYIGARMGDAVVVLTKQDYELYRKKFHSKYLYQIYNPASEKNGTAKIYNGNNKKIISVGRLCYQKNYPLLIQVAQKVLKDYPEWTWDIYGEGKDRPEIERMIQENNLEKKIFLKGQVVDLYKYYPQYDFLVMTSRYEGFGMVLVEAMQNALPVVAFDVECGPREIIDNEINGFLIPPFDDKKMTECIENLCASKELRKKLSANTVYKTKKFDIKNISKQWIDIFASIKENV